MAFTAAAGGRVRGPNGRFVKLPGKQFAAGGGRASINIARRMDVNTSDPNVLAAAVLDGFERAAAFVAIATLDELIQVTPVRTGYARACWIPGFGGPSPQFGGDKHAVSQANQEVGRLKLMVYKVSMGDIFISNNAPYIMRLNAGWSAQAPIEFIETAVDNAQSMAASYFAAGL